MENKKLESMTKKELMEKIQALQTTIDDMETQLADKDTAFASLHGQHVKFGQRAAKEIAEYEKKNEAIHEEAKRWKKEAVEAQAELDDLRSAIGADDSDPISVAIWKAKYHTLKYQFDKLKDEGRKWTSTNPAVQASLEREIDRLKKEASEWEAKYEYQKGQTDCVIKDYNKLNGRHEALLAEHTVLSSKYNDMVAYFENRGDKKALEERIKDLIKQCDELYDRNKELDAENEQRKKDLRETVKENNLLRKEIRDLNDKHDSLKKTVNKMYGIASSIPDTADFEDRARRCAIIFSKTIDDMIRAYNMDVNSYYDGSIAGVAKTVNTIHGGKIWLDALEESMRKFSEEAEKYIRKVGGKND